VQQTHLTEQENTSIPIYSYSVKIRRAISGFVVFLGPLMVTAIQAGALPNVHVVAEAVDQHYNHLRSLEADFTEIYQGGGLQRVESGILRLKKPGKMRWDYRSPQEKLFVSNGAEAWLYLPQEKQARRSSLKKLEDLRSPLAFLLGKTKLEKELQNLSFAPDVQVWQPGSSMLRGVPRGMEDRIEQILIEVSPDYRILRILIHGTDESITEYRFSGQKENVELADRQFRFTPPPGSETVNEASDDHP
jgi:outer membrane lipoprotein carrier protein